VKPPARRLPWVLNPSSTRTDRELRLPIVQIEGLRKVYVRREHVLRYLEERTFAKNEVPA